MTYKKYGGINRQQAEQCKQAKLDEKQGIGGIKFCRFADPKPQGQTEQQHQYCAATIDGINFRQVPGVLSGDLARNCHILDDQRRGQDKDGNEMQIAKYNISQWTNPRVADEPDCS